MLSLAVELNLGCPACGASVALNAVTPRRTCDRCQRVCELPPELWAEILREPLRFAPTMHQQEQRDTPADTSAGRVQRVLRRQEPICGACRSAVRVETAALSPAGGWLACACGAQLAARSLPGVLPGVSWLIGEDTELLYGREALPQEPVVAPCPQCTAPLPLE